MLFEIGFMNKWKNLTLTSLNLRSLQWLKVLPGSGWVSLNLHACLKWNASGQRSAVWGGEKVGSGWRLKERGGINSSNLKYVHANMTAQTWSLRPHSTLGEIPFLTTGWKKVSFFKPGKIRNGLCNNNNSVRVCHQIRTQQTDHNYKHNNKNWIHVLQNVSSDSIEGPVNDAGNGWTLWPLHSSLFTWKLFDIWMEM